MFAVFKKGEFQNWWLNSKSDEGWVEQTCSAMGWNPADVEVYWFDRAAAPNEVVAFPQPGKLSVMQEIQIQIPDPNDNAKTIASKAWTEKESWNGKKYFPVGA